MTWFLKNVDYPNSVHRAGYRRQMEQMRGGSGQLRAADITVEQLGAALELGPLPDPDLFIRTGGERRISNFLLWNLAYTELYFCDDLWPDFREPAFEAALEFFASRQRRFGLTAPQHGKSA